MSDVLLLVVYIGLGLAWGVQALWLNPQIKERVNKEAGHPFE